MIQSIYMAQCIIIHVCNVYFCVVPMAMELGPGGIVSTLRARVHNMYTLLYMYYNTTYKLL